jgi:hypothetical protein
MTQQMHRRHVAARAIEALVTGAGLALILLALAADKHWLDQHVLPRMFQSRERQLLWWEVERTGAILLGILLLLVARPRARRLVGAGRGGELALTCLLSMFAVLLSVAVSEAVLRTAPWRGVDRWVAREEPLRKADARLGWANMPAHTGFEHYGGRRILYHFDADGHRVADTARPVDPARPAILFTGESIMLGYRLNWPETVAGRIDAVTGVRSANLAVNGYGTDQSFMRLAAELPRYAHPVAVVALFAPTLIERNFETDRPHLDAALAWHSATPYWRVRRVLKNAFLYRRTSTIENGIAMTRAVLAATVRDARARGAVPLILVPSFMPEHPGERVLRRRILQEAGLPYLLVPLDRRWRIPGDGHPDARANLAMARAILAAFQRLNLPASAGHPPMIAPERP